MSSAAAAAAVRTSALSLPPSPTSPSAFPFRITTSDSSSPTRSADQHEQQHQQLVLSLRTELALALNVVSRLSEENFDLSERVRELEDETQGLSKKLKDLELDQSIGHGWDEVKEGFTREWQKKVIHQQTFTTITRPSNLRHAETDPTFSPTAASFARRGSLPNFPSLPNLRSKISRPFKALVPALPSRPQQATPLPAPTITKQRSTSALTGRRHTSPHVTPSQLPQRTPLSPLNYQPSYAFPSTPASPTSASSTQSSRSTKKGLNGRPSPLSQCSSFSANPNTLIVHQSLRSSTSLSPTSIPLPPSLPTSPALFASPYFSAGTPSSGKVFYPSSTNLPAMYEEDEIHEGLGIETYPEDAPLHSTPSQLQHCPLSASAFSLHSADSSSGDASPSSQATSSPLAFNNHHRRPTNPLGRASPSFFQILHRFFPLSIKAPSLRRSLHFPSNNINTSSRIRPLPRRTIHSSSLSSPIPINPSPHLLSVRTQLEWPQSLSRSGRESPT